MKNFFDSNSIHGNVVFNFRGNPIDDLSAFAQGYHIAGKSLVEKMESSVGYPDYEGYPILFLYRHAIELFIKAIVYKGAKLLRLISDENLNTENLFKEHQLSTFLPAIKIIFKGLDWKWDFEISGLKSFEDFSDLIKEIDSIDPHSYNFRYPIKTTGKASLNKHFVINVIDFGKKLDPILDLLSGAITGLDYEWNITAEAHYEFQKIIKSQF